MACDPHMECAAARRLAAQSGSLTDHWSFVNRQSVIGIGACFTEREMAMRRITLAGLWVFAAFAVSGAVTLAQRAAEQARPAETVGAKFFIVTPSQIKWTDPPAGAARGTPSVAPGGRLQYAPIHGDPLKTGVPFAIRLSCSDGYKAAPHWHPADENIVVLKG